MTFLIYTVSSETIHSISFFKMATFNFLRWQLPLTRHLWRLTLPPNWKTELNWKGYPRFFHQNDCKGCTSDSLDGLGHFLFGGLGHFLLGLGATGKKSREEWFGGWGLKVIWLLSERSMILMSFLNPQNECRRQQHITLQ